MTPAATTAQRRSRAERTSGATLEHDSLKTPKGSKKVASSFTAVIDMLVDAVLAFSPMENTAAGGATPAAVPPASQQEGGSLASGAAGRGGSGGSAATGDGADEEDAPVVLDGNKRAVVMQVPLCTLLRLLDLLPFHHTISLIVVFLVFLSGVSSSS